ncbi:MAG: HAMP domain-containing sensor histidine kinase [Planctomycetia bacterium]|nr:HAMP domain-containing sensor histidine kinase [Planctomycetia bacterium]
MKHRTLDYVLFSVPVLFGVGTLLCGWLLWRERALFEQAYLHDEQSDNQSSTMLLVHAFQPLLEQNDLDSLDLFCETFAFDERSVAVIDKQGRVVVASPNANLHGDLETMPEVVEAFRTGRGSAVRRDVTTGVWRLYEAALVEVPTKKLVVRVSSPATSVSTVLNETLGVICLVFLVGGTGIVAQVIYIILHVYRPLCNLQHSAARIAQGAHDTPVPVPRHGAIRDLAQTVASMGQQLQSEINIARKQEAFQREFIANVSHEIKTPLTAILSSVQILAENIAENPEFIQPCLEILTRQTQRLSRLVKDILELAALEHLSNDQKGAAPISLDSVVRSAVENFLGEAEIAGVLLELTRCDVTPFVGNANFLEQAVENLISNALKYSGSPRVEVSLEQGEREIVISVRDFGIGIARESQDRIFERFYRVPERNDSAPDGTGLGLAIVRQVAHTYGGHAEVVSEPGQGCDFRMILPRVRGDTRYDRERLRLPPVATSP